MKVLTLLKALSRSPFHTTSVFWRVNHLSGSVIVVKFGITLPQYVTRPKKLQTALVFKVVLYSKQNAPSHFQKKSPSELKISHIINS